MHYFIACCFLNYSICKTFYISYLKSVYIKTHFISFYFLPYYQKRLHNTLKFPFRMVQAEFCWWYLLHTQATFSIPPSSNGHWLSATLPVGAFSIQATFCWCILIKSWRSICSVANICAVGILKEELVNHCKFPSFGYLYQLVLRKSFWSVHPSGFVLSISSLSYPLLISAFLFFPLRGSEIIPVLFPSI